MLNVSTTVKPKLMLTRYVLSVPVAYNNSSKQLVCRMLYFSRMKITISLILETAHAVALALWLGGQAALILLLSVGIGAAPNLFVVRQQLVVELSGIVVVAIQYLTRRKYAKIRTLFVADGIRHLITFAALLLAEYMKYGGKSKSTGIMVAAPIAYTMAAAEIGALASVSAITIWLQAAGARLAAIAAVPQSQSQSAVTPGSPASATKPMTPAKTNRTPARRGSKR